MGAHRLYIVKATNATVINATNTPLLTIATPAGAAGVGPIEIVRIKVGQRGTSTAQQLDIAWGLRVAGNGVVTGTAATPAKQNSSDPVSKIVGGTNGLTAGNATTVITTDTLGTGTLSSLDGDQFNNINGFLWVPLPEERFVLQPGEIYELYLPAAPTTLTGWGYSVSFQEV